MSESEVPSTIRDTHISSRCPSLSIMVSVPGLRNLAATFLHCFCIKAACPPNLR